jgi:DNA-binding response OmpR family regulator
MAPSADGLAAARGDNERLLLVARDQDTIDVLYPALLLAGYAVDTETRGDVAVSRVQEATYDLVVVDTAMPGLQAVERLTRRPLRRPPVLFLAGNDELEHVLAEVGLSGEDYVSKPVRLADLLGRVRLVLRRERATAASETVRHADLVLDDATFQATRRGRHLRLTAAEYRLLRLLVVNAGRVLSKEQIARVVWAEPREDNAIEQLVSRLRRKLHRDGPPMLRTLPSIGYVLESPAPGAEVPNQR